jgi:hypothetical protein
VIVQDGVDGVGRAAYAAIPTVLVVAVAATCASHVSADIFAFGLEEVAVGQTFDLEALLSDVFIIVGDDCARSVWVGAGHTLIIIQLGG